MSVKLVIKQNYYNVLGFHHKWNSTLGRYHPSIWYFIRALKDEQKITEISIQAARRGDPLPKRRLKWRRLEARIVRLKEEYNNGAINVDDYWNGVTNLVGHFV